MYQLKSVARRVLLLVPLVGLLSAVSYQAILPAMSSADALNPLTKRSLLLTSSSPGWAYTDGSGDGQYATPGTGPNGQKTGETFTFDTSTNSTGSGPKLKAFTFQYCTTAAGDCLAPGDDADEAGTGASGTNCDLYAKTPSSDSGANFVCPAGTAPYYADDSAHTDFNVVTGGANTTSYTLTTPGSGWSEGGTATGGGTGTDTTAGDFQVYENTNTTGTGAPDWVTTSGWTMTEANVEDQNDIVTGSPILEQTGANNFITLTNSTGITPTAGEELDVTFQPSTTNYITNPGQDSFFVKINDYSSATYQDWADNIPNNDGGANDYDADVVDGGVTVAQVMNQSIEIQTKVLETMDFSVGTVDPDTLTPAEIDTDTAGAESAHGECDSILPDDSGNLAHTPANPSPDTLLMGNPEAQYSLSPTVPYGTSSMFRVSTNAANGATVYYSGNTLADTENNEIAPMTDSQTSDVAAYADVGTEQFGLGLDYNNAEDSGDLTIPETLDSTFSSDVTTENGLGNNYWYDPTLSPLVPTASYGDAVGTLAAGSGPKFAFNADANSVPVPIATENSTVVDCSTGLVQYVADIAPSTPAGIYTTAINYLAAPEY